MRASSTWARPRSTRSQRRAARRRGAASAGAAEGGQPVSRRRADVDHQHDRSRGRLPRLGAARCPRFRAARRSLGAARQEELRTARGQPDVHEHAGAAPSPTQHGMGVPSASDLLPTAPRGMPAPGPMGGPGSMGPMGGPGGWGRWAVRARWARWAAPAGWAADGRPWREWVRWAALVARAAWARCSGRCRRGRCRRGRRRIRGGRRCSGGGTGASKPSWLRPWMVIAVILVLTGIVVILVAMSGPDVPPVPSK